MQDTERFTRGFGRFQQQYRSLVQPLDAAA
jgi:hypothetical protein